jgi:transcriptional regulator with XRE-family HTH domain
MIEAAQIRAARALLGVNQTKLSEWAGISAGTIKRIEAASEIRGTAETLWKIQTALEKAGVEFIPPDEMKGPGVRLKQARGSTPSGRSATREKRRLTKRHT